MINHEEREGFPEEHNDNSKLITQNSKLNNVVVLVLTGEGFKDLDMPDWWDTV